MDRTYSAFISHSSRDAATAEALVAELERSGLSCWIAPRDIRPGAVWAEEITRGIEASACFVLLFSDAANLSDEVYREVGVAAGARKPIFPVRLEDVPLSGRLRYYVASSQWIDALEGLLSEQVARLTSALQAGPTAPMPAAPAVDDPFSVPLDHDGPLLPAPRPGEVWEDAIGPDLAAQLAKAELGRNGLQWSTPDTLAWIEHDHLVLGASERVFGVELDHQSCEFVFAVPRWRERRIHDISTAIRGRDVWVAGNTFFEKLLWSSRTYGFTDGPEHRNPDWCRVLPSPDGQRIVQTGLVDGASSGNALKRFMGMPDPGGGGYLFRVVTYQREVLAEWRLTGGILYHNHRLSWSPTGRFIGLSSTRSNDVAALPWESLSGDVALVDHGPSVSEGIVPSHLAWHPAAPDVYATATEREGVHGFCVVDAESRDVVHARDLDRRMPTSSLAWSPDGRFLALGGWDQSILVWDFARDSGRTFLGHRGAVEAVHFSPDGQRLLSGGDDRTIRLWDPRGAPEPILTVESTLAHDYVTRVNGSPWSADGRMFAAFGGKTKVRVWRMG